MNNVSWILIIIIRILSGSRKLRLSLWRRKFRNKRVCVRGSKRKIRNCRNRGKL